jgi:HAMP domain-containing protein
MRLRFKILSGFLTLALMLLIAGVWSVYQLHSMSGSVQELLNDNYRSINASDVMLQALERQDSGVLLLLLGKWEEGRKVIQAAEAVFEEGYKIANSNITIPGERDYVEKVRLKYQSYKDAWTRPIVGTAKEGDLNWYLSEIHQLFLEAKMSVEELKNLNERTLYETASRLKDHANRAAMPGTVAIVAALVFSVIFSYLVNHFMIGPIIQITNAVEDFAQSRKTFSVDVATRDEIGDLAAAISSLCARALGAEQIK